MVKQFIHRYAVRGGGEKRGSIANITHLLTLKVLVATIDALVHFETG